ncbi:hypothetical protein OIU85_008693 [Salix viminalis]|uniref:Cytochrome P450 n=1 Tax=Salix viminalis TaxID=40686 RepID=A0A9Q0NYB0_SALVM|nr:hypothetical protein OIU85_008693 [Salix viminalis]
MSWFFWLLDSHPAVEEKILAEICKIIGEREDLDPKTPLVFRPEEMKKMDYLHAALSEALRLYPSVPVDHKEVAEDDIFPDGTVLKKGTKVIYAIYAMGRMEAVWGRDCREFKPERWLRITDGRFMSESAYKFTAFNGGPRLCLGERFRLLSDEICCGINLVSLPCEGGERSSRGAEACSDNVHESMG